MQIFFVVDKTEGLDDKINMLSKLFDAEFKFFVPTKLYTKINDNQFVLDNLAGVVEKKINKKIDEYIKSEKFNLSNVLLFYSSAEVSYDNLKLIKGKIDYKYDAIYLAKKIGKFKKFINKIYNKLINWMFKSDDALCYTKVQYISKDFMDYLTLTNFDNHIFKVVNSDVIEVDNKEEQESLKTKFKFEKYNVVNYIVFMFVIIFYILFANLFHLKFWLHFTFVMLILLEIALSIMFIINNIFNNRFKR